MTDASEHDEPVEQPVEQPDEIEPSVEDDAPAVEQAEADATDADQPDEVPDDETESDADAEDAGDQPADEPEPVSEPEAAVEDAIDEPDPADVDAEPASEEEASLDEMVAELAEGEEAADEAAAVEDADPEAAAAAEAEGESEGEPAIAALLASDRIGARWPFWAYLGVWAVFAGVMTYLLWAASAGPFLDHPLYQILVFGGAGLTVAGPLVGLLVFFITRSQSEGESRTGLLRTTLQRTATWTVLGVAVWCLALAALELHRAKMLG